MSEDQRNQTRNERIRQGKKGQEKSSCDKRGEECIEGERQTREGNVEDQSR